MAADARRPPKVAMLVSRFPKVTETFQLREMVALEKMGVPIELYAITHHDDGGTVQAEAAALDARANYFPRMSWEILKAQFIWLRRNPAGYVKAWKWSIASNLGAPEFLLRSFLLVPLAAAMALRMERDGVEHVHAHFATYPTHAALVIKWLAGIPFSFTGHAHDIQVRQDGIGAKIEESEFFVCCTRYSLDSLRSLYGDIVDDKGNKTEVVNRTVTAKDGGQTVETTTTTTDAAGKFAAAGIGPAHLGANVVSNLQGPGLGNVIQMLNNDGTTLENLDVLLGCGDRVEYAAIAPLTSNDFEATCNAHAYW